MSSNCSFFSCSTALSFSEKPIPHLDDNVVHAIFKRERTKQNVEKKVLWNCEHTKIQRRVLGTLFAKKYPQNKEKKLKKMVLRPGFEPGSAAREAAILDRTILPELFIMDNASCSIRVFSFVCFTVRSLFEQI